LHDNAIVVRRMEIDFPDDIPPVCVEGEPERSYLMIALSLLLPYLEPYLIRTMKVARKHINDPLLLDDLERFSAQEGQHYRQHKRFNDVIRTKGFPRLAELEGELDADYRRFTEKRSLRFNLAYAEGFEALTTATALFSFETESMANMHPSVRELFSWHLIEELEHRTVAFDVYDHVCGSYPYRLVAGLYAQWHMARWIGRVAKYMLEADPDALEKYGGLEGRKQRQKMVATVARKGLLPKLLRTYLPGYTPERIAFTDDMIALAREYSDRAVVVS
jgi:predicted metal-dependent hydrolase